jgi:hypothetical protein
MDRSELRSVVFKYIPYDHTSLDSEVNDTKIIEIKDIIPEEVGYSYSPNFTAEGVLGRMSPIQMYTGGSDIVYTFTLSIHEDMLENTDYTRIDEFVDAIKALSYPYLDKDNITRAQRAYFQLGELSGTGYIKTGVNWKKPLRNGRYIMVDLSFTITVEKVYPKPVITVAEEEVVNSVSYAVYYNKIRLSDSANDVVTELAEFIGYDISITDFVTSDNISTSEKRSNINYTESYFDRALVKFGDMLERMSEIDPDPETLDGLKSQVSAIQEYQFGTIGSRRQSYQVFTDLDLVISGLEDLKDQMISYIEDDWYTEVNIYMTEDERIAVVQDITVTIDAMIEMYKEVYTYGKSN